MSDTWPIARVAKALREEARYHKRLERAHRTRAREIMQSLQRLQAECRALGIQLTVEGVALEEMRHGRAEQTDPVT